MPEIVKLRSAGTNKTRILTVPVRALAELPDTQYFTCEVFEDCLLYTPVRV